MPNPHEISIPQDPLLNSSNPVTDLLGDNALGTGPQERKITRRKF